MVFNVTNQWFQISDDFNQLLKFSMVADLESVGRSCKYIVIFVFRTYYSSLVLQFIGNNAFLVLHLQIHRDCLSILDPQKHNKH